MPIPGPHTSPAESDSLKLGPTDQIFVKNKQTYKTDQVSLIHSKVWKHWKLESNYLGVRFF